MVRVTSVGCFLLVIVFLNVVVLTNACAPPGSSCNHTDNKCCISACCFGACVLPCQVPGKRAKLLEFFRQR
uniref:I2_Vc11.10 prepropeptide n=1 Tax=Conus victoriae TaxID=319920 RepID=W4VS10_CONVC